jgi:hypothetical protein
LLLLTPPRETANKDFMRRSSKRDAMQLFLLSRACGLSPNGHFGIKLVPCRIACLCGTATGRRQKTYAIGGYLTPGFFRISIESSEDCRELLWLKIKFPVCFKVRGNSDCRVFTFANFGRFQPIVKGSNRCANAIGSIASAARRDFDVKLRHIAPCESVDRCATKLLKNKLLHLCAVFFSRAWPALFEPYRFVHAPCFVHRG